MFQSLKQKIAKETGQDITRLNYTRAISSSAASNISARNSLSSNHSQSLDSSKDELSAIDERESEISILRQELAHAQSKIKALEDEKKNLEIQRELFSDETDKIQNAQFHEIEKLKSLLVFREQESLDQLNKSRTDENQIEGLKNEISRIKNIEEVFEKLQVNVLPYFLLSHLFLYSYQYIHSGVTNFVSFPFAHKKGNFSF